MPILVEKVRIKNFRSLKDIEVTLSKLTLLVGTNNAGKTSFLRALNLALGIEKKGITKDDLFIDKSGNRLKDDKGNENNTITIDLKIIAVDNEGKRQEEFDNDWLEEFKGSINDTEGQSFLAFQTKYTFNGDSAKSEKFSIKSTWENPIITESSDMLQASLENIPLYFVDAQRDIIDDLRNRTSYFGRLATSIEYNPTDKIDIETKLETINKDAVDKSDVMKHVKTNLANLNTTLHAGSSGVEITPFSKKLRDLHKSMKIHFQDNNSDTFELDYHGMGTRSWASLLAFKAFVSWENNPKNKSRKKSYHPLLALEEPEAHLHPNAQRQLYKQLSEIEGQKIISTHSPYIVGLADLTEIRYFSKKSDEVEVRAIDVSGFTEEQKRKAKYENLQSKGELLFSRLVVLIEGPTEEQLLPILFDKYFGCAPFELGVNIVACEGTNYKMLIRIFKTLDIDWVLFSDYDTPETKTNINSVLTGNAINIEEAITNKSVIALDASIEKYLIQERRTEMINACTLFINSYMTSNERTKNNFLTQINTPNTTGIIDKDNDGLYKFMSWDKMKAKLAPYYAEAIDNSNFPPKIKDLFDVIKTKLNIT